ncbi:helix-turn-helix domain-containing protein [Dactylosporangium matsuzakiense]|uniref:helix-turn-helix domain-containing protein n=1 Tax=Dactylosporangium matsuzakiense TaxID=53360 RepID=UPI0021C4ADEC|nr:helix-turn-helix transcriptional regulator [Dactylosporangium matsuzakiense]UWZ45331.1 helix-turn-helix transcriptional regulator [Dactylosporangium matsuzakiense]
MLVLRGDPGIGKSALLDQAAAAASGSTVLRCAGVPSEADIPYAGVHQLLGSPLDGPAVLARLIDLAPVACFIDDAQWLDDASARALRYAARRLPPASTALPPVSTALPPAPGVLLSVPKVAPSAPAAPPPAPAAPPPAPAAPRPVSAAPRLAPSVVPSAPIVVPSAPIVGPSAPGVGPSAAIVMIFAARDEFDSADLPAHRLGPLRADAAERLVADLPASARARVLAEAAGNPLALLELPRTFPDHRPLPLPPRIQAAFAARLDALPPPTRAALHFVAADPEADLATLFACGCTAEALAIAEEAGLIEVVGARVAFTHPLLRAAVYRRPTFDRRLSVHRALAAAVTDPVRRAWHLADAATGPDEEAAAALEAVGAWERAADLSADATARDARLVAAAYAADSDDRARALLDRLPRDRAPALRARLAFAAGDAATAHDILVTAAAKASKPEAGELLVAAARNAWLLGDGPRLAEIARLLHARGLRAAAGLEAVRAAVEGDPVSQEGRQVIANLIADRDGPPEARRTAEFVAGLVGAFEGSSDPAAALYLGRFDEALASVGSGHSAALTASAGSRPWVALAGSGHSTGVGAATRLGAAATGSGAVGSGGAGVSGASSASGAGEAGIRAWLAAVRGDDEECVRLAATADRVWAEWALALLDLARGRADAASDRFERLPAAAPVFLVPDRVEAAVRAGRPAVAADAAARLEAWPWPSNWATAAQHRCRAVLGTAASADTDLPWEAARTHLVLGERLRRERRKTEARGHLRAAAELFDRLGAAPWAERARAELRAAGEAVAEARAGRNTLSPQERQIVRLAAAGRTNREIAAMLFISPKTVSYHLYRAFPKLGVTSRTQLARLTL